MSDSVYEPGVRMTVKNCDISALSIHVFLKNSLLFMRMALLELYLWSNVLRRTTFVFEITILQ